MRSVLICMCGVHKPNLCKISRLAMCPTWGLPLPSLLDFPFELLSQLLQIETNWAAGSNTRTNYIVATYRLLLKLYQGFGL